MNRQCSVVYTEIEELQTRRIYHRVYQGTLNVRDRQQDAVEFLKWILNETGQLEQNQKRFSTAR